MPNRCTREQYQTYYESIAARDGECCLDPTCKKGPPAVKLQIDHANNNPRDWHFENLHFFCQRHNLMMRSLSLRRKMELIARYSALRERERINILGIGRTPEVRQMVDYREGSAEMRANSYLFPLFRTYSLERIQGPGQLVKKDLINDGAMFCNCSQLTIKRYLDALCSSEGPFKETQDDLGNVVIVFRQSHQRNARPAVTGTSQADRPAGPTAANRRSGDTVPITRESQRKDAKSET